MGSGSIAAASGIQQATSAGTLVVMSTSVLVTGSSGSNSAYGVFCNIASGSIRVIGGMISGATVDVRQISTTATVILTGVTLAHPTVLGSTGGFVAAVMPSLLMFGVQGALTDGATRYMYPGNGPQLGAGVTVVYRVPQACIVKSISVQLRVHTGGSGDIYNVMQNGVGTIIFATVGAAALQANDERAVAFAAGDTLGVTFQTGASSGSSDAVVTVELY